MSKDTDKRTAKFTKSVVERKVATHLKPAKGKCTVCFGHPLLRVSCSHCDKTGREPETRKYPTATAVIAKVAKTQIEKKYGSVANAITEVCKPHPSAAIENLKVYRFHPNGIGETSEPFFKEADVRKLLRGLKPEQPEVKSQVDKEIKMCCDEEGIPPDSLYRHKWSHGNKSGVGYYTGKRRHTRDTKYEIVKPKQPKAPENGACPEKDEVNEQLADAGNEKDAEIAALQETNEIVQSQFDEAIEKLQVWKDKALAYEAALVKYGRHKADCPKASKNLVVAMDSTCTCGLDKAKKDLA